MKKILLATTALASAVIISGAAQAADITISGSYELRYDSVDKGDGMDNSAVASEADIAINFENTTDSGITTKLAYSVEDTHAKFTIASDFGTIDANSDGDAVSDLDVDVDTATPEEKAGNVGAGYTGGWGGSGNGGTNGKGNSPAPSLSYTLPTFVDGLKLAYSLKNATGDDEGQGYGLNYGGSTGGLGYKIAVATSSTSSGGGDTDKDHLGLSLTYEGLNVMAEVNSQDSGDGKDRDATGIGATYGMGSLTLGAFSRTAETSSADNPNEEYSLSAYSLSYSIAPGLSADITSSSESFDDGSGKNSADAVAIALKASF